MLHETLDIRTAAQRFRHVDLPPSVPPDQKVSIPLVEVPLMQLIILFCDRLVADMAQYDMASRAHNRQHGINDLGRLDAVVERIARIGDIEGIGPESLEQLFPAREYRTHWRN